MGLEVEKWALDQELCFKAGIWDLGVKARIWESKEEFGPPGCDLGLEVRIWALRYGRGGLQRRRRRNLANSAGPEGLNDFCFDLGFKVGGDGGGGEEGEIWYGQQAPKDPMTYA